MQVNLCLGCMEPAEGCPCPHCGYTPNRKGAEFALLPGSILNGKYMVGKILGQGGFGITYIGWDIALERKVAIKEYYPSGQVGRTPGTNALSWYTTESAALAQKTGLEMFLKEARKMSKVDSIPGIVRVRDLFQENGTAYIVMDFVEGETLKTRLQKNGPMPWDRAKEIFRPAVHTMEQVHRAGLIHRDLSPDNLMLTPDGQVKILDLGAAKDLNINSGASSMQVAKGGFSPFEQYSQRGASGPWTDVYAMAATIYYTLTGVLPPAAIDRVEEDTLDWSLVAALPWRAQEALKAAMVVSAKKRTQSMEELEKGLFGEEAETAPETAQKAEPEKKADPKVKKEWKVGKKRWIAAVAIMIAAACGVGFGLKVQKAEVSANAQEESARGKQQTVIAAGGYHTVALHKNGTVVATGNNRDGQCDVNHWQDVIAVAAGKYHTIGLRSNGTVLARGNNADGQCQVKSWKSISAVAAGDAHTVGLRSDGTVIAVGKNSNDQCNVGGWTDIVAISAGGYHTIGLRSDGTVVATGLNNFGQCDVSTWNNIVAISAGYRHTVGLRSDGTVVAVGLNTHGECDVTKWSNIVAISGGSSHTVGLHRNGRVVATGYNKFGQCNVDKWTNIVSISAGLAYTIGLRSNGKVCATGISDLRQCDVSTWRNIRTPS